MATLLGKWKATCEFIVMVRFRTALRGGVKSAMPHNDITSTGEKPAYLRTGCVCMVCPTTDGGEHTECRQSNERIVLVKVGNAAGGKPKGDCSSQSFHAK